MSEAPARLTFVIRLQAALVRGLALVLRALPPRAVAAAGSLAGALFGRMSSRRFGIALDNLEKALGPEVPPDERRRIARRVFRHFGRAAFEMITLGRFGPGDAGRIIEYEGLDRLKAALARGKGAFLFSAHYGNWETAAVMQGFVGFPLAIVTRPLDNPLIEEFFRSCREVSGNRVIGKRNAVRHVLRALSEGLSVAIVIDQNVRSGARVFVPFFGRPAATTPTLALLALKTGAPVLPVFSEPLPGGRYRVVYGPEVGIERTGDRDRDVLELTRLCTSIIEAQVRANPSCWLWMHERWKSRPRRGELDGAGAAGPDGQAGGAARPGGGQPGPSAQPPAPPAGEPGGPPPGGVR